MKSSLSHTLSYFLPHSHSLSYLYNHNINLPLSLPCSSISSSKTASLRLYYTSVYTTLSTLSLQRVSSPSCLYISSTPSPPVHPTWDRLSLVFSLPIISSRDIRDSNCPSLGESPPPLLEELVVSILCIPRFSRLSGFSLPGTRTRAFFGFGF